MINENIILASTIIEKKAAKTHRKSATTKYAFSQVTNEEFHEYYY